MLRDRSHTAQFPKWVDPRQPKLPLYFAQQSRFKSQVNIRLRFTSHTAIAGRTSNKRLFSRSQSYRESNTPPLTPQQTNRSPTGHTDSLHNSNATLFEHEKYSSVHLKGLAADPKISRKTLHIWHILPRIHGKKKTKVDVRTLIQAYFQD